MSKFIESAKCRSR